MLSTPCMNPDGLPLANSSALPPTLPVAFPPTIQCLHYAYSQFCPLFPPPSEVKQANFPVPSSSFHSSQPVSFPLLEKSTAFLVQPMNLLVIVPNNFHM